MKLSIVLFIRAKMSFTREGTGRGNFRKKTKEDVLLILECSKIRALKASSRKEKLLTNPRGLNPPPYRLEPGKALPFEEVGVATSELFAPA
ncbi:hypothetical protein Tco_0888449 [Tanacetum coccineum]